MGINILLTGAGFTKDFGGYLASEMWSILFNKNAVHQDPELRRLMLKELNFELTYDQVRNSSEFSAESKAALTQGLIDTYKQMQTDICRKDLDNWLWASSACRTILGLFVRRGGDDGLVFTLNQDLFLEQYYARDMGRVVMPGIEYPEAWFQGNAVNPLGGENVVRLPGEKDLLEAKARFQARPDGELVYIKLHGSYVWEGCNGQHALVIGNAKTEAIASEPLLVWYHGIFKEALARPDCNLVIIGYGFRDKHINSVIVNSLGLVSNCM